MEWYHPKCINLDEDVQDERVCGACIEVLAQNPNMSKEVLKFNLILRLVANENIYC